MKYLGEIVFIICIFVLILVFAGDPDIADAVSDWLRSK